jgi:hypothetical protein
MWLKFAGQVTVNARSPSPMFTTNTSKAGGDLLKGKRKYCFTTSSAFFMKSSSAKAGKDIFLSSPDCCEAQQTWLVTMTTSLLLL